MLEMLSLAHYFQLCNRLNSERSRLASAKSKKEIDLRKVWICQLEKEISSEIDFLKSKGVNIKNFDCGLSDDDLLRELNS